jgi:hypothetical protein
VNVRELLVKFNFEADHSALHKIESNLEGIKHRLELLATVEVVHRLYEMAEKFGEFGESIEIAAKTAGISTDAIQKLSAAAADNAVSAEEMQKGMAILSRKIYAAKEGSDEAKKSFRTLGLDPGQFKNSEQAIYAIANKMAGLKDNFKKAAVAQDFFGRGGYRMIAFLSKGSEAIKQYGEEWEKMGLVLTESQVESLLSVDQSFKKLNGLFKSFGAVVASRFAPVFDVLIAEFISFFNANKGLLDLNIHTFFMSLAWNLGFVAGLFVAATAWVTKFAKALHVEGHLLQIASAAAGLSTSLLILKGSASALMFLWGAFKWACSPVVWVLTSMVEVVTALALRLAILTATSFPALSNALLSFAALLEATPIGWIITAVALLTLAIHDLWKAFHGDKTWTQSLLEAAGIADWVEKKFFALFQTIEDTKAALSSGWDRWKKWVMHDEANTSEPRFGRDDTPEGVAARRSLAPGAAPVAGALRAMSAAPGAAASAVGALGDMGASPGEREDRRRREEPGLTTNNNSSAATTLNAPIVMNIYGAGHDAAGLGVKVKESAQELMERLIREARRSTYSGVAY